MLLRNFQAKSRLSSGQCTHVGRTAFVLPFKLKHSITNVGKVPAKVLRCERLHEARKWGLQSGRIWKQTGRISLKVIVKKPVKKTSARKIGRESIKSQAGFF